MIEWILTIWLFGCGFSCDTKDMPKYEPFETRKECEDELLNWIRGGAPRGSVRDESPWYSQFTPRDGQCEERPIR